jgi:hypothetical protein
VTGAASSVGDHGIRRRKRPLEDLDRSGELHPSHAVREAIALLVPGVVRLQLDVGPATSCGPTPSTVQRLPGPTPVPGAVPVPVSDLRRRVAGAGLAALIRSTSTATPASDERPCRWR